MTRDDPALDRTDDGLAPRTSLSPPARACVTSACPAPDRALSTTLFRVVLRTVEAKPAEAAETAATRAPTDDAAATPANPRVTRVTEALVSTLVALEGYARIRGTMIAGARTPDGIDPDPRVESDRLFCSRDVALLASDYLFARAHHTVAAAPLDADVTVAAFRTVSHASRALVTDFSEALDHSDETPDPEGTLPAERPPTAAVLCTCALSLGAIAGGIDSPAREYLEEYGRALGTVVDALEGDRVAGSGRSAETAGPLGEGETLRIERTLSRLLRGDAPRPMTNGPVTDRSTDRLEDALDAAARALEALEAESEAITGSVERAGTEWRRAPSGEHASTAIPPSTTATRLVERLRRPLSWLEGELGLEDVAGRRAGDDSDDGTGGGGDPDPDDDGDTDDGGRRG